MLPITWLCISYRGHEAYADLGKSKGTVSRTLMGTETPQWTQGQHWLQRLPGSVYLGTLQFLEPPVFSCGL